MRQREEKLPVFWNNVIAAKFIAPIWIKVFFLRITHAGVRSLPQNIQKCRYLSDVTIGSNLRYNKIQKKRENVGNPIIAENVTIADGAKILGPIIIGENIVIGAGAIITKSIPANSIAYGIKLMKSVCLNLTIHREDRWIGHSFHSSNRERPMPFPIGVDPWLYHRLRLRHGKVDSPVDQSG